MKWATVRMEQQTHAGLLSEDGKTIHLLKDESLMSVLDDLEGAVQRAGEAGEVPVEEADLAAPIPRPGKILGIGLNYAAHASESVSFVANKAPDVQKWFNKQVTSTNGPYDPVHLPLVSDQLDYEAELVVVIGRSGRHVAETEAMGLVAGFACGCDYSVRDWQRVSPTMIMGKGFDTHAPFGPFLVTPDEVAVVEDLTIRGFVNDELRQEAQAGDMTFNIAAQIAHLTKAFTLEPGDVIFTGTPAGVGAGFSPPKWLCAGDKVRVEIDGLGHLENMVVPEPAGRG